MPSQDVVRFLPLQRKENQQLGILRIAMRKALQLLLDCHKHNFATSDLEAIERFVVLLLYGSSSSLLFAKGATRWLFTKKGKTVETIPPSQNALVQHILGAVYQTRFVWKAQSRETTKLTRCERMGLEM